MKFVAFGLVAAGVAGGVTMGLWNALMPALFHLPVVSFWQALGLLMLSRLLFGGFRKPGGRRGPRFADSRFAQSMTPEEKQRFRDAMRQRCEGRQSPA